MSFSKQLKLLLHPYIFVLKEGKSFTKDCMSYDLMLLQISNEIIKSPKGKQKSDIETIVEAELTNPPGIRTEPQSKICESQT